MYKVFVVDDSVGACVAIERILSSRGFDVVWERLGKTGLLTVERHAPDLIICDLVMPDIDGYDFCRSVRENPFLRGVPLVLMSGILDQEVEQRAGELGVDAVLSKPFTPEQLMEAIEGILGPADPDEATAPLPAGPGSWDATLGGLDKVQGLRFACVVDGTGDLKAAVGPASEDAGVVGPKALSLVRGSGDPSRPSGRQDLRGLIVEAEKGTLLLRPLSEDSLLVVALDDPYALGMARYLVHRACPMPATTG